MACYAHFTGRFTTGEQREAFDDLLEPKAAAQRKRKELFAAFGGGSKPPTTG